TRTASPRGFAVGTSSGRGRERGKKERGRPMSERLLPISAAIAEIWAEGTAPRERTVREDMMQKGFAFRVGRQCYTTPALIAEYKEALIPCRRKSVTSGESSSPFVGKRTGRSIGSRGGSSRSARPKVELPEDELSAALAVTRQRLGKRKRTGSTGSTKSALLPSSGR